MSPYTHPWLLDLITHEPRLNPLWRLVTQPEACDAAHDPHHLLRVARWTCQIMAQEQAHPVAHDTLIQAIAAALLHDLVNLPKNHPDRAQASAQSADKAHAVLRHSGFDEPACQQITDAIRTHSFSRGETPNTLMGKALQDADRLDALGAIGMLRCFATAGQMGTRLFHTDDPWAMQRPLEDQIFAMDHFFCKLLVLHRTMQTPTATAEALARTQVLRDLLRQLGDEIGHPFPQAL